MLLNKRLCLLIVGFASELYKLVAFDLCFWRINLKRQIQSEKGIGPSYDDFLQMFQPLHLTLLGH